MKNLIKLLILVSVNMPFCCGMTEVVKLVPSLQDICMNYCIRRNLIPKSNDIYDFSCINTEVSRQIVFKHSPDDFKQITMLYGIPDTIFEYREKCLEPFLRKHAIVVCSKSKKIPSFDGKETLPLLLQEDIAVLCIDSIKNCIGKDSDIHPAIKEKFKTYEFSILECLWLFSFYLSAVAFSDTIALDDCDDALKENAIVFNEDVKEILMNQSKRLQKIQPKYGWNLSKLSKNPRMRSKSH